MKSVKKSVLRSVLAVMDWTLRESECRVMRQIKWRVKNASHGQVVNSSREQVRCAIQLMGAVESVRIKTVVGSGTDAIEMDPLVDAMLKQARQTV